MRCGSAECKPSGGCDGGEGDSRTEGMGLKFAKVKWKYTPQRVAGGAGGNTSGGWDLATNKVV